MSLEEKILEDFKQAMKSRDSLRVSILSFIRAQFSYIALEKKKTNLDDNECIAAIKKSVKQHQDSIEQFKAGGRQDLVDKEAKEVEILKGYLPKEMSEEELRKIVEEAVISAGAIGIKDMGRVMKEVLAKTAGSADGKMVSEMVKNRLAPAAP